MDELTRLQAVFARALALHEANDPAGALPLYQEVARALPDADIVLYNLGLALYQLERYGEAVATFEAAVSVNPGDADTWYNLGLSLRRTGQDSAAEQAYLRSLELRPDAVDVLHNLGCVQMALERFAAAIVTYTHLLSLDAGYAPGLSNLAYLQHRAGKHAVALDLYRRLLSLDPEHEQAQHMVAALQGETPATPPPGYVRQVFDAYSEIYEQDLLETLAYRIPEEIGELLGRLSRSGWKRGLDLGCGTGLTGAALRPLVGELIGVDLSPKMLEVAAGKGIYDQLLEAEATRYLEAAGRQQWHLIVAADVLIYIGDLEPLFRAVARNLARDGIFCCTTELAVDQDDWSLGPNGRYAHSQGYVQRLCRRHHLQVLAGHKVNKRKEAGAWIRGVIWLLKRQEEDQEQAHQAFDVHLAW